MISVVTFVGSLLDSSPAVQCCRSNHSYRKNLIYILASSSQLYRIRLLYNAPQLEMLLCGSGRNRTYSAIGNRLRLEECMILRYFQPISNQRFMTVYSVITVCPASPTAALTRFIYLNNFVTPVGLEPTTPTLTYHYGFRHH